MTHTYGEELQKAGFQIAEDGTLTRTKKENRLEEEEKAYRTLFSGEDSYGKHLLDVTVKIGREALSSIGRSPKLYTPNGSFRYVIEPGTLYSDIF